MKIPSRELIERLRAAFPVGTRVELVRMDDVQAPPIGEKGTVTGVDDMGSIMVNWDHGGSLSIVYGEDVCRKLPAVTTVCYGKVREWNSREDAEHFFKRALSFSEGHERKRYKQILIKLKQGATLCTDEEID